MVDTSTGEVQNVAWHGEGADYINGICHRHNGDIKIPLPCNRVLVNDQPVIHNDIENARTDIVWKNFAMEHGFRSMAAFPLRQEGKVIGILALYSNELNFFSQQESELFMEVAADTALGLEYINKDQHMAHALYHDILTGLPNRRLLEERLQQDILRANHHDRHIGVTIINITGFRRLAGIYGSSIADKTLTFIANHLLQKVRDGDTIAHLEGDEFAILFNDVGSVNDIITTATNLITEMPAVVNCAEHEVHFHMHAGIAIYPNDGEDYSSLIRNATLACATRKMAGAHSINFYSPGIQQQAQRRELIEKGLRSAIEREDELELHYQPVVDIHSHQIVSVEALARWHSKELGAISPVSFIPVAEESGLILPLGQWALASACKQIEAWRNLGIDNIKIAVNVSFVQLRDKHFITQLSEHIANIGQHSAHQLSIEITESELMDNIDATITQMNAIKGLGIACYLDDFGTGYSSLSHLHNLPLDVIKIDQSFIRSLGKNDSSTSIVKMIITLAQNLNLKTIAEGVETTEQLSLLQQFGCNFVQGYLFSKPKAANEITLLLQEGKPLLKQPLA
jgi:diguanylate cyclase (GGDEF)-like protein